MIIICGYAKLPSLYNAEENLTLALPLPWPFAIVLFLFVFFSLNALTTIVMAHVETQVCLKINKQSWNSPEPPLISTRTSAFLSCLMTEAGGMGVVALLRQDLAQEKCA